MNTRWQYLHDEKTENSSITKHVYEIIATGSCQCYKDCDCSKEKGKIIGLAENFTTPFRRHKHGSPKKYKTYKDCLQALNS